MHKAWERAQEQMMAVLDDVTLDSLAAAPQPAVR
jgi:DNA-binding IscR family transcriptional regulator